jgi:hypothetical protein
MFRAREVSPATRGELEKHGIEIQVVYPVESHYDASKLQV